MESKLVKGQSILNTSLPTNIHKKNQIESLRRHKRLKLMAGKAATLKLSLMLSNTRPGMKCSTYMQIIYTKFAEHLQIQHNPVSINALSVTPLFTSSIPSMLMRDPSCG